MWEAYVEAAREVFGEAVAIVIDRFQVMKNFQEHLTAARRELQRALPARGRTGIEGESVAVVHQPGKSGRGATPAADCTTRPVPRVGPPGRSARSPAPDL